MKLIPINKGKKKKKTRYNSCRTETNKTKHTHRIKLRIKETIFLFIRNTHTQTKTLSQQAENETNQYTQHIHKQIKLYKQIKKNQAAYIEANTQNKKKHTHTFKPQPRMKTAENQQKKNNCQNKIRTIVFNKNDKNRCFLSLYLCFFPI